MGFLGSIFGGENKTLDSDIKKLGSLAGYETGIGEADTTAASKYYTDILSGDQSRINQALAPQVSAGQKQVQQAAGQNAQFGTRSGGTAASTAGAEAANRGNIINETGRLQSTAASGASNLGTSNLGAASSNTQAQANESQMQMQNFMNSIFGKGIGDFASTGLNSLEGKIGF